MPLKYFGTDGIRGKAGIYPVNVEFVLKLGWAVGKVLSARDDGKVLVGKDTRLSGYMFESALEAGLSAAGIDVYLLGPIPTPAIAYLTRTLRAEIGIVISASHNPYQDNGIKFFSAEGLKLNEHLEQAIESTLEQPLITANSKKIGRVYRLDDAHGRYIEFCKSAVPHYRHFKNLKIIIDCANGATYTVAPQVFSELQATVIAINCEPNGVNINKNCGSTNPTLLQTQVLEEKADLGIAFDGDGDRVIMVDHKGEIVDGDELLFIIANHRHYQQSLNGGVVGTQMSNFGLELALKEKKIPFIRVQVGDKNIIDMMLKKEWFLGGESSGHIICYDMTTTGDGIISALQILEAMHFFGKDLHDLKKGMQKFPQIIKNVKCKNKTEIMASAKVQQAIKKTEDNLNGHGRVLLRASGTEPVIRVMVEGENETKIRFLATELAELVSDFGNSA